MATASIALVVATATARGGGGGGFGGGGGGGGGGFGGGGGGGYGGGGSGGNLSPEAAAVLGVIFVGLFLFVVIGGAVQKRRRRAILEGRRALRGNRRARALAALRAVDPDFDTDAFLGRVRTAFLKVQDAWCGHDLDRMAPFTSDGIVERFALQLQEQQDAGVRDRMSDITIDEADLAEVVARGALQAVTVMIRASAIDQRVSAKSGKVISGSGDAEVFVEYWTFLRRRGARTKTGAQGLIEGACPNCGAGIEEAAWARCLSCGAHLRSGAHDWVLTEITQASVWEPARETTIPGVDALLLRDPEFSTFHLEDRVSVMAVRWAAADRRNDNTPLVRVADPELVAHDGPATDRVGEGDRWWADLAIGAVTTIHVHRTPEGDGRAVVRVLWSGVRCTRMRHGELRRGAHSGIVAHDFVVVRPAGTRTDAASGFASAHCPACGAPDTGDDATERCSFCGSVVAAAAGDWRLTQRIARPGGALAPTTVVGLDGMTVPDGGSPAAAFAGTGPRPGRLSPDGAPTRLDPAVLPWLVKLAAAGGIESTEQKALERLAGRAGLRRDELREAVANAATTGLQPPRDADQARAWIESATEVALADGRITKEEDALLLRLGEHVGLLPAEVRGIRNRVQRELVRLAKDALREEQQRGGA